MIKIFDINDWKNFDVSFEAYFNGDENYTVEEYEELYKQVAQKCNESGGEYTIDCYHDRYTVRKTSDIEAIRCNDMSEEDKAAYDKNKSLNNLYNEKRVAEARLKELDYIGVKIATGRATADEYAAEIAEMKKLADDINRIDAELAELGA